MSEIWRVIRNHGGYEVSDAGNIRGLARKVRCRNGTRGIKAKVLRAFISSSTGYLQVALHGKRESVHRLVAIEFCEGQSDGLVVNHKDGRKTNNHASNLEWVTHSENLRHGYRVLGSKNSCEGKYGALHPTSKPVLAKHIDTGKEHTFECALDAIRSGIGKDSGGISRCCSGTIRHHNGYKWAFAAQHEVVV